MTQATELRELATLLNVDSTDVTIGRRTSVSINDATEYSSVEASELNPVSTDALYLFNTENSSTYGKVSILMRSTGGGGGAAARITLKNDRSGNSSLKYFFRDSDHSSEMREKFVFTSKGELGIGTTGPSHILDIHKTDATEYDRSNIPSSNSGSTIRIINNDTANGPSYAGIHLQAFGASTNIARSFIGIVNDENWINGGWSGTHHHLTFATRGSNFGNVRETMILTSDGNLGIGEDWGDLSTKRPIHKLDVDGAIGASQVRHSIRPTLNLDFANSKELDSRITFYRDSIATYYDSKGTLKYANINEPRFDHDPATGESKGLLIEEARTNIFNYTNNPERWPLMSGSSSDPIANNIKSPDGTFNATSLIITGSDPYFYQNSLTLNGTYTFSYWIKAVGTAIGKHYTTRITNVSTNSSTAGTLPSEWTRYTFTFTTGSTTTAYIGIEAPDNSPADGDEISIWGAQLELGGFATSLIPSDTRFTSRSSAATYHDETGVLRKALANSPRYGYKYDGRKWVETGLILEQGATNYLPVYPNLVNRGGAIDLVLNATTAPDGSNAHLFKPTTTSTLHRIGYYGDPSLGAGNICFSVYMKAGGYRYVAVNNYHSGSKGAGFDLETGTITAVGAGCDAFIEEVANGWYRCSVSYVTTTTNDTLNIEIRSTSGASYQSFAGDGTSGIYTWGMQMENSLAPSSYIYTTDGSTATRSADVASSTAYTRDSDIAYIDNDANEFFAEDESTIYVESETYIQDFTAGNYNASAIGFDGYTTNDGRVQVRYDDDSGIQALGFTGGAYSFNMFTSPITTTSSSKVAISMKENDFNASINGSSILSDSGGAYPDVSKLYIGCWNSSEFLNGPVQKISYYDKKLANAELQALTENN